VEVAWQVHDYRMISIISIGDLFCIQFSAEEMDDIASIENIPHNVDMEFRYPTDRREREREVGA
jgi:hypothetical protein